MVKTMEKKQKPKSDAEQLKDGMKSLGIYKPEYDKTINELAAMYGELEDARAAFAASGGQLVTKHTNKGGSTNLVKNPYYAIIEGLQLRILKYANELGLTPQGYRKATGKELEIKAPSPLVEALNKLDF